MKKLYPVLSILIIALCAICCSNVLAADKYEPDNSQLESRVLLLNDQVPEHQNIAGYEWRQFHDFDQQGDEDWVIFYASEKDTPYTLSVKDTGTNCDAVIELYNSSGTLMFKQDDRPVGMDENAEWVCTQKDFYYAKISQYDPDQFGADTQYTLTLYQPVGTFGAFVMGIVKPAVRTLITTDGLGEAITLSDGSFFMPHVAGSFTLTATASNYEVKSQAVTITEIKPLVVSIDLIDTTIPQSHKLSTIQSGTGSGIINRSPQGNLCDNTNATCYTQETLVTLTTIADEGSTFSGWSGDCAQCANNSTCQILVSGDKNCTATFNSVAPETESLDIEAKFNKNSYSTMDQLIFTGNITGDTASDLYIAIVVADGTIFTMKDVNLFSQPGELTPYKQNFAPSNQFSETFLNIFLQGVPSGNYGGYVVAVEPGADPLDETKWINHACQWITIH